MRQMVATASPASVAVSSPGMTFATSSRVKRVPTRSPGASFPAWMSLIIGA